MVTFLRGLLNIAWLKHLLADSTTGTIWNSLYQQTNEQLVSIGSRFQDLGLALCYGSAAGIASVFFFLSFTLFSLSFLHPFFLNDHRIPAYFSSGSSPSKICRSTHMSMSFSFSVQKPYIIWKSRLVLNFVILLYEDHVKVNLPIFARLIHIIFWIKQCEFIFEYRRYNCNKLVMYFTIKVFIDSIITRTLEIYTIRLIRKKRLLYNRIII